MAERETKSKRGYRGIRDGDDKANPIFETAPVRARRLRIAGYVLRTGRATVRCTAWTIRIVREIFSNVIRVRP